MVETSNNFRLIGCDTDAVFFCNPDGSALSKERRKELVNHINSISPEYMIWDFDGYYPNFIVLKTKNYITKDEYGEVTLKGSSLKSATLEPILKQFLREIIDSLLEERNDFVSIYHKYIRATKNITDIKPWSKKITLSATTYESDRPNETKIIDVIEGSEYIEGDRVYIFVEKTWKEDGFDKHGKKKKSKKSKYALTEKFNGIYDQNTLLGKLHKATERFWTILDENIFLDYTLVRNKKVLELITNSSTDVE